MTEDQARILPGAFSGSNMLQASSTYAASMFVNDMLIPRIPMPIGNITAHPDYSPYWNVPSQEQMRIPASTTQAAYPSQMTARLAYASSTFPTSSYPIDNRLFNDARGLYHSLDHAPSHPGIYSTSVGHLHNAGNRAQAQSQHSFIPPQPFADSGSNYSAYQYVGPEAFYSSPASSITPLEAISPMYSHSITNFTTHPPHSAHTYPHISPIYPQGPMTYAYITPSYSAQPSPAPFDTVTDCTSPALLADMPYNNIASMPIDADRCLQRGHAKPSRQRYAPYSAKRSTHRSSDHYSVIVSDDHCAPGVDGSANSMASTSSVPSRCVFSSPAHLSGSSPASYVSDAMNESSWSSRPYFDTVPAAYYAQTPSLFLQGPLNAGAQITSIPLDTAPDNSSRGLDPSMAIQDLLNAPIDVDAFSQSDSTGVSVSQLLEETTNAEEFAPVSGDASPVHNKISAPGFMPRGEPACIHHDTVPLRRSPLPSQSTSDSALDTFSTQEGHTLDGRRPSGSDQPVWAASASSYAGESNKHSVRRDGAQIVSKRLCRSPSATAQQIRISTPTSASTNMTGDTVVVIKREAQVITIPYDNGLGDRLSPVRVKFATDEQDFISVGSKFIDDLSRLANPGDPAFPELEGGSRKVSFRMIFRDIPPSETECKQKRIPGNVTRLQLARSAGKAVAAILQRPAMRSTSIKREEDAIEDDKERLGITERKSGSVKPECSYDTENVVLVSAEFVSRGSIDLVLGIYEKEHLHIHKQEPIELIVRKME